MSEPKWNLNTIILVAGFCITVTAEIGTGAWFASSIYSGVEAQAKTNETQDTNIAADRQEMQAHAQQIIALEGQVTAVQNFIHDRTAVSDARNVSTDTRLRSVEVGQTGISADVKNVLAMQTAESADIKQMQAGMATLNTAVALLSQQRGQSK